MKIVLLAIASILLLAMPAHAQMPGGASAPGAPYMSLPSNKEEQAAAKAANNRSSTTKADEKAYKSALDSIPQTKSYDPWGNVREKPQSKNARQ